MPETVTLSLISHTNVGKTTLARTLLRRDVGEVLDQAHVTEVSEAYTLIETADAMLRLWDTPGFGDTTRLLRRLRREKDPLGWFLHQVWDRVVDRPLWCSQEATRNIKSEADVVLYLVNAAENPAEAGYVRDELELLAWIGRPVLVLLNQVGIEGPYLSQRWREFVAAWPVVRDVLSLDAFTRCWVEEGILLDRVALVLPEARREVMRDLATAWRERSQQVFATSCRELGAYLARAAVDREPLGGPGGTLARLMGVLGAGAHRARPAMTALRERLERATREMMQRLIAGHGLEGESAARIERHLSDYQTHGAALPIDENTGAIVGATVSGALGGLAADVLSGGLSLGGGMITGGILGGVGGAILGRGYRLIVGESKPWVAWSAPFLHQLSREALLRYLTVAHFGRGRGAFEDHERSERWDGAVAAALEAERPALDRLWQRGEREGAACEARLATDLERIVERAGRRVLRQAYPGGGEL